MCVVKEAVMGWGTGHKQMHSGTVLEVEPKNPLTQNPKTAGINGFLQPFATIK
jgi:hypothetical protein